MFIYRTEKRSNMLSVPRVHTTFASRGFSIAAPSVLNSFPAGIHSCSSSHTHSSVFLKPTVSIRPSVSSSGSDKCLRFTCDWHCHWRCEQCSTGECAPFDFQLFNFSCHCRVAQTMTWDFMGFPTQNHKYTGLSFVTVYRMNFIWYFCVSPLNYFLFILWSYSHQILTMPLDTAHYKGCYLPYLLTHILTGTAKSKQYVILRRCKCSFFVSE